MAHPVRLLAAFLLVAAATGTDAAAPPPATETVTVQVPAGMDAPPFDAKRSLRLPPGFSIAVYARIRQARFMAVAPNGDLLVTQPSAGRIVLVRNKGQGPPQQLQFASGLRHPQGLAFDQLNGVTYLYIADSNRVLRARYRDGQTTLGHTETVVDHLPDGSGSSGGYAHPLKNIALHRGKLYVSIGSSCNVCASDTTADPVRGTIYQYDADGSHRHLYARGLRNAEGLAFEPGTDRLWVVVNSRDNMAFPRHDDRNGDGHDDFGKVMQSYVDGHPPDLLTLVKEGGNYGWPFCNPDPDQGLDDMHYERDVQTNADGNQLDCNRIARPTLGIAAHSAPLGLSFLSEAGWPAPFRHALVTALHGCWNCSRLNGHKVAVYPLGADGKPGAPLDLVTGWITDADAKQRWGRPVDAVPDRHGGLYISDDYSGAVYLLRKTQ